MGLDDDVERVRLVVAEIEHEDDDVAGGVGHLVETLGLAEDAVELLHLEGPPAAGSAADGCEGRPFAHRHHLSPRVGSSCFMIFSAACSAISR
ncbi:MAG: hypothetical protein ABR592_08500 [Nitriliruptorales bacterium]